jgi:hypothetical protein
MEELAPPVNFGATEWSAGIVMEKGKERSNEVVM